MGKKSSRRAQAKKSAMARKRRKRLLVWFGVAAGLIVIAMLVLRNPLPEELAAVESFAPTGRAHLAEGEAPPDYSSSPATSGDHSASSADCGIYTSEIPDQIQVHNLEHGTVVIQYRPELDPGDIEALREYARTKPSHILVAPRSDLDDPVVVTSWTRMLRLESVDLDTIDLYYERFAVTGPEVGVPCAFAIDQSL